MSFADELRSLSSGTPHLEVEVDLYGIEEKCRNTARMGLYMVLIHNFGLNPPAQKIWKEKYGLITRTSSDTSKGYLNQTMIDWFPST